MADRFRNQQRWVLFLMHARDCKQPGVKCPGRNCVTVQKLLRHMSSCVEPQCLYPRCGPTKSLINHYKSCKDLRCPVCVPVKTHSQMQANVRALAGLKIERSTVKKADLVSVGASSGAGSGAPHCDDTSDNLKLREDMRTLVFSELQKQFPCPADDASKAKYLDVTRSLEEALYQMANTKEEYINPSTLEARLSSLIKRRKFNDYNQIQQNAYSAETMMEIEKVPENGSEMAEILKSMSISET